MNGPENSMSSKVIPIQVDAVEGKRKNKTRGESERLLCPRRTIQYMVALLLESPSIHSFSCPGDGIQVLLCPPSAAVRLLLPGHLNKYKSVGLLCVQILAVGVTTGCIVPLAGFRIRFVPKFKSRHRIEFVNRKNFFLLSVRLILFPLLLLLV